MTEVIDRVLTLIETIVHELITLARENFEILFITTIYLGVAWILATEGMREELSYWLTSGAMIGAICALVNRYGASRYKSIETNTLPNGKTTTVEVADRPVPKEP